MFSKTALNERSAVLNPADLANVTELTFYIVFEGAVSAGAMQAEECHVKDYTGTWAPVGSVVNFTANSVKTVKATGLNMFAGVRISTAIVDGAVSVYAMGR